LNEIKRQLAAEARLYAKIIIDKYAYLGQIYRAKAGFEAHEKRAKNQVRKVKFDYIACEGERIYLRIATTERAMFGWRSALPAGVRVADLVSDEFLIELSHACKRKVEAKADDFRKGAWLIVNRLEGVEGIPKLVSFEQTLKYLPSADFDNLWFVAGVGEHKKLRKVNFAKHPHALIAGSSGGGKSNALNVVLATLMRSTPPHQLKFLLIDLKRVEFSLYEDAPNLLKPIVYEPQRAIDELKAVVDEMEARYRLLQGEAKDATTWNKKHPDQFLPRIIIAIDEYAVLRVAVSQKIAEQARALVVDISARGRAVAIHVIVCTQLPNVKVIDNGIKVNMDLILSARTQNPAQSMVILGNGRAALLPDVPGRMIFSAGSTLEAIQSPFVSDDDVRQSVRIARGRSAGILLADGSPDMAALALYVATNNITSGRALLDLGITGAMWKDFKEIRAATPPQPPEPERSACISCGKVGAVICEDCLRGIHPPPPQRISDHILETRVSAKRGTILDKAIQQPTTEMFDLLAARLAWVLSESHWKYDLIIPTPDALSVSLALRVARHAERESAELIRVLLESETITEPERVSGRVIVLIDDIANGRMERCALALLGAGATAVYGLAVTGDVLTIDDIEEIRRKAK
jgi:hypothetical protein